MRFTPIAFLAAALSVSALEATSETAATSQGVEATEEADCYRFGYPGPCGGGYGGWYGGYRRRGPWKRDVATTEAKDTTEAESYYGRGGWGGRGYYGRGYGRGFYGRGYGYGGWGFPYAGYPYVGYPYILKKD